MIITTNIPAMNVNRNLKNITEKNAAVSEKLSSGLRINKAADDAAGLAISEKMRAQIRGLQTASRNVEDGISLVQIGDGALQEITNMLQRIRELSVQAANDTNTQSDKEAIQKEVDKLISEINIQSQSANFNGIPLFDGSHMGAYGYTYGLKNVPITSGGTNPTVTTPPHSLTQLQIGGANPPDFPMEGIFAIEVQEFGREKVTAVIDFGSRQFIVHQGLPTSPPQSIPFTEPSIGDFSRTDFDQFFINTFTNPPDGQGPIASYTSSSGVISVTTVGFGGSQASVEIGKRNFTPAEVTNLGLSTVNNPVTITPFVKYVNSSIFGENKYIYCDQLPYNFIGLDLNDPTDPNKLKKLTTNDPVPTEQDLWDMIPDDTEFIFQIQELTLHPPDAYHPNGYYYDSPPQNIMHTAPPITKAELGTNFANVNNNLAEFLSNDINFIGASINISHFVDREGNVRISLINPSIPNPEIYPPSNNPAGKFSGAGNWVIRTSPPRSNTIHSATTTPPTIRSDYPLTISDEIGTLTITIGGIPNAPPSNNTKTATIVVDFANNTITSAASGSVNFTSNGPNDTTDMLNTLNQVLNHSAHAPNPPSIFPDASTNQYLIGVASVNTTNGWLEIALSESCFSISMAEKESDRPILLHRYYYQKNGIEKPPPKGLWIQGGANKNEGLFIYIPRLDAYDLGIMIRAVDHAVPNGSHRVPGGINGDNSIAGTGGVNMGDASYTTDANIEPQPMGYGLDVTTQEKANAAIKIVDNAIEIISSERTLLGASQNRLEYMGKNVDTTAENLTFAESRIRDTDIAKEIIEYTKTYTILQESMSMLNRANKALENTLQLFR